MMLRGLGIFCSQIGTCNTSYEIYVHVFFLPLIQKDTLDLLAYSTLLSTSLLAFPILLLKDSLARKKHINETHRIHICGYSHLLFCCCITNMWYLMKSWVYRCGIKEYNKDRKRTTHAHTYTNTQFKESLRKKLP